MRTVLFSPSREDRRLALVIYYDVIFGKSNFAIGVANGSKAKHGVLEGGNDLAGSGKSVGKLGIPKSDEPLDCYGWLLAVPLVIVCDVGSKLIVGAFFEK